jgi:peptide chain release factor 1
MPDSIEALKKEYQDLLNQLSDPELISNWEKFEELSKRKNYLEKVIEKDKELENLKNKVEENKSIISAGEDPELVSLAEAELTQIKERERVLENELKGLLKEGKEPGEPASVIVEIRAGAGGEEAALFAADLFRMYSKYGQIHGWKQKVLNSHSTGIGGFKEIIFELKNGNVFSRMKYEGGVHRVQRIPETEKSGRIHTSTASVAVLPKPKKTKTIIRPDELKIDYFRASGPGGQYVNKRETAVRITHLPTGIVVNSQTERNQLQNKENAMSILEAKILEKKEIEEAEKLGGKRKAQIGWAKRAEKIRTYNFPQDRVTDHRIKKSFHNISAILAGDLDTIIEALKKAED